MSEWQEPWGAAIGRVSHDIDGEFGEAFVHVACTARPNYQAEPDSSRPPYVIVGVFRNRYAKGLGQHGGIGVDSRAPHVSFDRCSLRYPPEQGTRFQRCCSGDWYEVKSVEPDGLARVVCRLNQMDRQYEDGL